MKKIAVKNTHGDYEDFSSLQQMILATKFEIMTDSARNRFASKLRGIQLIPLRVSGSEPAHQVCFRRKIEDHEIVVIMTVPSENFSSKKNFLQILVKKANRIVKKKILEQDAPENIFFIIQEHLKLVEMIPVCPFCNCKPEEPKKSMDILSNTSEFFSYICRRAKKHHHGKMAKIFLTEKEQVIGMFSGGKSMYIKFINRKKSFKVTQA